MIRLLTILLFLTCGAAHAASRSNIVFVLFDDIGYGEPTCYRADSPFKTGNIDRLAREGMRFTDAHAAASCCTPTRYGLLTGRYPSRIGQFGVLKGYSAAIIPESRPTVASFLKKHGYHTACIGKWHLGMNWIGGKGEGRVPPVGTKATGGPNAIGFDYFFGFTHADGIGSLIEQDEVIEEVEPVENQPRMIRKAVEYIAERAKTGEPFFLYFPTCPPHKPHVPAPEFIGKGGVTGKGANYADWVHQGDEMLGELLDALERGGVADNTLVVATGDNGAANKVYAPLRKAKGSIYEGGHREPFVARWPGKIKPGSTCDETICLNDLFATCAGMLGEKLPDHAAEDSVSFLPHLTGTADGALREATVHQAPNGELAIRRGKWKLVFHNDDKRELFDLDADLGETRDLAAAHGETVERLTALMQNYIDRGRSTPGAVQENEADLSLTGPRGKGAKKEKGKGKKKDKKEKKKTSAGSLNDDC